MEAEKNLKIWYLSKPVRWSSVCSNFWQLGFSQLTHWDINDIKWMLQSWWVYPCSKSLILRQWEILRLSFPPGLQGTLCFQQSQYEGVWHSSIIWPRLCPNNSTLWAIVALINPVQVGSFILQWKKWKKVCLHHILNFWKWQISYGVSSKLKLYIVIQYLYIL